MKIHTLLFSCCTVVLLSFFPGCRERLSLKELLLIPVSSIVSPEDFAYMQEKVRDSGKPRIQPDLSDEIQFRFLKSRLSYAGKTPENSPQLYNRLHLLREKHIARENSGVRNYAVEKPVPGDHFISDFRQTNAEPGSTDPVEFEASVYGTMDEGSTYSYIDIVTFDAGDQIGSYGWDEQFDAGEQMVAFSRGTLPPEEEFSVYVDSMQFALLPTGDEVLTYTTALGDIVEAHQDAPVDTNPYQNPDYPVDAIVVCLDRNYGDCDYSMNYDRVVRFPLKGYMQFTPDLSPVTVKEIITDPAVTFVKLSRNTGGTSDVQMNLGTFGDFVCIGGACPVNMPHATNPHSVYWDIPQDQGNFGSIMFNRYEEVNYFLQIKVSLERPDGSDASNTGRISSIPGDGHALADRMSFVFSCLAEGSRIRLSGGEYRNIEAIAKGTRVVTDEELNSLAVVDISVGRENIPMVRITDGAGNSLLLTESHPVVTVSRGILWAADLAEGDQVYTEEGIGELVRVEREMFSGAVYNLKLGGDTEILNFPGEGHTFYANGFLVGDLSLQATYEFRGPTTKRKSEAIPIEWRTDYQNSRARERKNR